MATYDLCRMGNYGSLEKSVKKTMTNGDYTEIKISVSHIKEQRPVTVRVTIHKWVGWDDSHAFLEFPTVKEGWKAFRQLCDVLEVTV